MGKKKEKLGHCCRYRDDDEVKDLHILYEEPEDDNGDGCDDDEDNVDWYKMEEKEQE